ncbi:hypothetical protein Cni_G03121 [Canna indica]|uniref:Uncharacterized protein n=1 Tax=Canna indica TaxID=4628 RepID=A0AAQ3Q327_9LILI|nr:hypothetical protein Cni_G03121 [Canna indica]
MRRPVFTRSSRLIREVKISGHATPASQGLKQQQQQQICGAVDEVSWWVPDPRTGIYYPKGHEWVMEDVPRGASSFPTAYWLRNFEGVEKSSDSHLSNYDHPFLGF